ncbi:MULTISPECIES: type VII secretion protein EccCa [Clavibacter]|uniref:Cell division protein FtsK n=1 Tax=Clavibacter tessellarius TaxID=31965 RepID=A0A154UXM0_9MICO|nr:MULTISPECIES: type VII secretion protein EccCa [Clavibacter]KZC93883.1 cell division protein FtsK [Clavibacter michiganensis subsp. tessellarius]MDA3804396.1 type VII secretion protein EccCa [Clavibacter sp. CT19]
MNRLVHRPSRVTRPLEQPEQEALAAPPAMQDGPQGGFPIQSLIPILGATVSVTMMTLLRGQQIYMVIGALVLVVAAVGGLAMAFTQRSSSARTRRVQRERYLDYLERVRSRTRARAFEAREQAALLDPAPVALTEIVRDPARLWERRRSDADFLRVRLGSGTRRWLELALPPEANPVEPYDPIMAAEAEQVVAQHEVVRGMPITVDLAGAGHVSVIGPRDDVLNAARALIAQLAVFHAPDDMVMALTFPEHAASDWRGVDRLPHLVVEDVFDGPVPARRVAPTPQALRTVIGEDLADRAQLAATARRGGLDQGPADIPRLVVFMDDYGSIAGSLPVPDAELDLRDLRITIVHLLSDRLHEPSDVTLRILVGDGSAVISDARLAHPVSEVTPDRMPVALLDVLTRALAPLRLSMSRKDEAESARAIDISELLGIGEVSALDPAVTQAPRSPRDFLRVPVGLDDFGEPLLLDIKEASQLGIGPHGLCVGATGSGKSEFLRTFVLALASSHSPEDLAMILVDYKGGAAFAPFASLPHVAGLIDNLADDPQLTQRARASLAGEVVRRQKMLKDAGNVPSITHYAELRTTRPDLPGMPHLLLIIDEFGELLTAEPDLIDLLIQIGRIGRTLGIHMLLSSQRLEAGKLRGLDTYLSYRIALRTFSEAESSMIIDTSDAFRLPAVPGYAYLKFDTTLRRFRSGYVSGAIAASDPDPQSTGADAPRGMIRLPTYNGIATRESSQSAEEALARPVVGRVLVDLAVERIRTRGEPVAPVWLPPLPERLTLASLVDRADQHRALAVPVGLLDEPDRQRQEPWILDLTRSGGHAAIFGAPQSGRTTFLRTVVAGLALTHSPDQVAVYGLDFSGGGLSRVEGFPHVGGIATRTSREKLQRVAEEMRRMLTEREAVFPRHAIDSLATLRRLHAEGRVPELDAADVVLVVDEAGALRGDHEDLEPVVQELLQRGGSYGIHVVLALTRWNDLRTTLQPFIGTRIELRLNDALESLAGRRLSETLRAEQPGRAITDDRRFAQIALPVLETEPGLDVGDALERLARDTAARWQGSGARAIRLLPENLPAALLPDAVEVPVAVPVGLAQETMQPALLDHRGPDPHLLVFGDPGAGKSNLLRVLIDGSVQRSSSDELVVALVDFRGALADACPDDYLGGYAGDATQAGELITAIAGELTRRRAEHDTAAARILLVIDDHDIVAASGADALRPLLPFIASARDLRLTVALARPVAGTSRAFFDIVLQSLRDNGATAVVMSGERSEGQIVPGIHAERMVPGRARVVRRGARAQLIQIALHEVAAPAEEEMAAHG